MTTDLNKNWIITNGEHNLFVTLHRITGHYFSKDEFEEVVAVVKDLGSENNKKYRFIENKGFKTEMAEARRLLAEMVGSCTESKYYEAKWSRISFPSEDWLNRAKAFLSSQPQDREGLTGEQIAFAKWLAENTEIIREPKITLYRYCDRDNRYGNYTLEDIYIVYSEETGTSSQPNKQTLTDEGSRYDELEKQVVELLGVTGQPNVLSVIEYVKMLQSK